MAELGDAFLLSLETLEENLGAKKFPDFIQNCENAFFSQIQPICDAVRQNPDIFFILISGPTSSGKTTFTHRLRDHLVAMGRRASVLSLDDYYLEGLQRYDEAGRPDLESVDTLELTLLHEHLRELSEYREVCIPSFDFSSRKRSFSPDRSFRMEKGDILLIEGLHALSDTLLNGMERGHYLGVFIMPNARLLDDRRVLSPVDVRRLRRISRDVRRRGASALSTLDYWPMIDRVEKQVMPEYLKRADFYINSFLSYEFCITAPLAERELKNCLRLYQKGELPPSKNVREGVFYADLNLAVREARRLSEACDKFPEIDTAAVPPGSILQEFI